MTLRRVCIVRYLGVSHRVLNVTRTICRPLPGSCGYCIAMALFRNTIAYDTHTHAEFTDTTNAPKSTPVDLNKAL